MPYCECLPPMIVTNTDMLNVAVCDGKYTVIQNEQGAVRALRYGEEWRDCVGDGLIVALAYEVDSLRKEIESMHEDAAGE